MGRARCTLKVQGLDCPVEVDALHRPWTGAPGWSALGFDLIHGTMTVDYDPGATDPAALVAPGRRAGRDAGRAARRATESRPDGRPGG